MIKCIYTVEPKFPATDQNPQALRAKIGIYWVDYIGMLPTQAAVDAIVNPIPTMATVMDSFIFNGQLMSALLLRNSPTQLAHLSAQQKQKVQDILDAGAVVLIAQIGVLT